jgi:hypothetical protein
MDSADDEKEVLKKLLVDERDVLKELAEVVNDAKDIFQIENPSGRIIFKDSAKLTDMQRVAALLVGKYFAMKLGLIHSNTLGLSDIAKEVGRPMSALSGPVGDLTKKGLLEKLPTRKYGVAFNRIRELVGILPKPRKS